MYVCMYIYIYIYMYVRVCVSLSLSLYIYIYMAGRRRGRASFAARASAHAFRLKPLRIRTTVLTLTGILPTRLEAGEYTSGRRLRPYIPHCLARACAYYLARHQVTCTRMWVYTYVYVSVARTSSAGALMETRRKLDFSCLFGAKSNHTHEHHADPMN